MSQLLTTEFLRSVRKTLSGGNIILGTAIVSVLLFVVWKLSVAPLYQANDAAACQREYLDATTLAETTRVDFLPYNDSTTRQRLRCGETRKTALGSIAK